MTDPSRPARLPACARRRGTLRRQDQHARDRLAASLIGLVWGIGFLADIICGYISLSQIKKRDEHGRGLAIAGLIIGYVGTVLTIITIVVFPSIVAMYQPGILKY